MNVIDELTQKALDDSYLEELIIKAEKNYSKNFIGINDISFVSNLSEKEFSDLLRFADILCRSKSAEGRNKAYKIVSLLYDNYKKDSFFQLFANTVFTKLGIFPAFPLLSQDNTIQSGTEITLEKVVKKTYQESPIADKVFTDAQYKLFEKLKNSNHFSFSGPTSFGKSFIMEAFINHIIETRNASDNIVVLVPTRALINQVSSKLKQEIKNSKYKILTHPVIPTMFKLDSYRYIFVFTPERWISYVSDNNNPVITYMFIDEAHKIVSSKDSRSPLYYHAILLAERKSVNLFFASPNIPNAEIFLELFEKSQDETMVIQDSPVAQNRYYFDFVEDIAIQFSDTGNEFEIPYKSKNSQDSLNVLLKRLGHNCKNIVYCNTIDDTIDFSRKFANQLPEKNSKKIDSLITLVKTFIHKEYYLIDCLRHGVAFHFGRLPQRIREQVEELFLENELDYIFCTSTLLEGVNLPAKNIFILNNAIGLSKFNDIDFWNLAGRAGRLSKELSGNIICVRAYNKKNRWDDPQKDLEVVRKKKISNISPTVMKGEKNFYKNLGNSIQDIPFTKKNSTQSEIDIWNHYANILSIHQIGKNDSVLMNNFLKKNQQSSQILNDISKNNAVPLSILEQSSMIKIKYQNIVWNSEQITPLPKEVSLESCEDILNILYENYNWKEEESGGRNPLARERARLKYFSILMFNWIQGQPLNMIINNLLKYYRRKGMIFYQGKYIEFDSKSRQHINIIINELMADIDTSLRFKIKNYLLNYSLICNSRLLDTESLKWVDYLEYGTTDSLVIGLQNLGIPRHLSNFIITEHYNCLHIENSKIVNVDIQRMKKDINQSEFLQEYNELKTLFEW